jgi:hypothetical protein
VAEEIDPLLKAEAYDVVAAQRWDRVPPNWETPERLNDDIRLGEPVNAVRSFAREDKSMGPEARLAVWRDQSLRLADRPVDPERPAHEAYDTLLRVSLPEFLC